MRRWPFRFCHFRNFAMVLRLRSRLLCCWSLVGCVDFVPATRVFIILPMTWVWYYNVQNSTVLLRSVICWFCHRRWDDFVTGCFDFMVCTSRNSVLPPIWYLSNAITPAWYSLNVTQVSLISAIHHAETLTMFCGCSGVSVMPWEWPLFYWSRCQYSTIIVFSRAVANLIRVDA